MSKNKTPPRPPLSKDRVLQAAVDLADSSGLAALTMRRLGTELGVEAMSLYKHVANKDEIVDGMLDLVVSEIEVPEQGTEWKQVMTDRATSAREVLVRHSWAIGLLELRGYTGPATRRYIDAIIGTLLTAGFSLRNAAHAFWLLDSYVYGHVIQEVSFTNAEPQEPVSATTDASTPPSPADHPNLTAMQREAISSPFDFDEEFTFGLDLIMTALETSNAS